MNATKIPSITNKVLCIKKPQKLKEIYATIEEPVFKPKYILNKTFNKSLPRLPTMKKITRLQENDHSSVKKKVLFDEFPMNWKFENIRLVPKGSVSETNPPTNNKMQKKTNLQSHQEHVSSFVSKNDNSRSIVIFNNSLLSGSIANTNESSLKDPSSEIKINKKLVVFSKLNGDMKVFDTPNTRLTLRNKIEVNVQEINFDSSQKNNFQYRSTKVSKGKTEHSSRSRDTTAIFNTAPESREDMQTKFLFLELERQKNMYYRTKLAIRMLV